MAQEAKKYEQINQDYSSPYDETGADLDGAGDADYFDPQGIIVRGMEVPRLEITRATGSTGRSLTQSDDSIPSHPRPLSKRLQEHIENGKKAQQSLSSEEEQHKRTKPKASVGNIDGHSGSASDTDQPHSSSRISSRPRTPRPATAGTLRRTLDPRVTEQLHETSLPGRSPTLLEVVPSRKSAEQAVLDEVSITTQSVESAATVKHASAEGNTTKPHKRLTKAKIKDWLNRKVFWMSGKGKGRRGSGRIQSEQSV